MAIFEFCEGIECRIIILKFLGRAEFIEKVRQLCRHKDPEVAKKSETLLEVLAKISPMRESMYSLNRILQ